LDAQAGFLAFLLFSLVHGFAPSGMITKYGWRVHPLEDGTKRGVAAKLKIYILVSRHRAKPSTAAGILVSGLQLS
jgi:hypothetical protein